MRFTISPPPEITQNTESYLVALRDYLYQMADAINAAGNALDSDNFTVDGMNAVANSSASQKRLDSIQAEASALRQLIVKTADSVETEIDTINQTLEGYYNAVSEYGSLDEYLKNVISVTAGGIIEDLQFDSRITDLANQSENFNKYMTSTQARIQIGMIQTDSGIEAGVAIGEEIRTEIVHDGDEDVEVLTSPYMLSTFTASELAFYQNDVKLAWFNNNQLYVSTLQVQGDIIQGSWLISSDNNGWSLKYIGV